MANKRKRKEAKRATSPAKKTKHAVPPSERRVTRSMTVQIASRQAVFGTTELLESILLHLTPSDVLSARRVCQEWNETVKGSTVLQQRTAYVLAFFGGVVVAPPQLHWCITGGAGDENFAVWKGETGEDARIVRQVVRRNERIFETMDDYLKTRPQTCLHTMGDIIAFKPEFLELRLKGKFSGPVDEVWMQQLLTFPGVTRIRYVFIGVKVGAYNILGCTRPIIKNGPITVADVLTVVFATSSERLAVRKFTSGDIERVSIPGGQPLADAVAGVEKMMHAKAKWERLRIVLHHFTATDEEIRTTK